MSNPEEKHATFEWKIFERRFEVSCNGELFAVSSSISTMEQAVADMLRLSGKGPVKVSIESLLKPETEMVQ